MEGIGSHHGLFGYTRPNGGWESFRFVCHHDASSSFEWQQIDSLGLLNDLDNSQFSKFFDCYRLNPVSIKNSTPEEWFTIRSAEGILTIESNRNSAISLFDLQGRLLHQSNEKAIHQLRKSTELNQVCILVIESEGKSHRQLISIQAVK